MSCIFAALLTASYLVPQEAPVRAGDRFTLAWEFQQECTLQPEEASEPYLILGEKRAATVYLEVRREDRGGSRLRASFGRVLWSRRRPLYSVEVRRTAEGELQRRVSLLSFEDYEAQQRRIDPGKTAGRTEYERLLLRVRRQAHSEAKRMESSLRAPYSFDLQPFLLPSRPRPGVAMRARIPGTRGANFFDRLALPYGLPRRPLEAGATLVGWVEGKDLDYAVARADVEYKRRRIPFGCRAQGRDLSVTGTATWTFDKEVPIKERNVLGTLADVGFAALTLGASYFLPGWPKFGEKTRGHVRRSGEHAVSKEFIFSDRGLLSSIHYGAKTEAAWKVRETGKRTRVLYGAKQSLTLEPR